VVCVLVLLLLLLCSFLFGPHSRCLHTHGFVCVCWAAGIYVHVCVGTLCASAKPAFCAGSSLLAHGLSLVAIVH
jgi:hypothetical protein